MFNYNSIVLLVIHKTNNWCTCRPYKAQDASKNKTMIQFTRQKVVRKTW